MALKKYESFLQSKKVNEELGWKDAVLGVLSLFALGDVNAKMQLKNDSDLKAKVETILKDETQRKSIVDSLAAHGMKNPDTYLQKNADALLNNLENIGKKSDGQTTVVMSDSTRKGNNWQDVKNKLYAGYALTGVQTKTLRDTILRDHKEATVYYDTVVIKFNPDQLFEQGSFELKPSVVETISSTLETIHNSNCLVTKVTIESSTDKQRIGAAGAILQSKGYEQTNKGLSQARNDAFKKEFTQQFSTKGGEKVTPIIEQIVKSEQGKGEISAVPQDPSARYVTATIYGICVDNTVTTPDKPDIIEKVISSFTFAKTAKISYDERKTKHPGGGVSITKTGVPGGSIMSCPAFK